MRKLLLSGKIWMLLFLAVSIKVAWEENGDEEKLTRPYSINQATASATFEITTGNRAMQKGILPEGRNVGQNLAIDHAMDIASPRCSLSSIQLCRSCPAPGS